MQNLEEISWQCVQQSKEIDNKIFHLWVLKFDNKCNALLKLLHQIHAGFSSKNLTVYSATSAELYYKCFPLISPKILYT